ncbi:hypothetical protein ON010_g8110 [Phytophthora cinnamomi]|nr:hypothetical protein ON010_g8110 [Phytophthora cinnamomi]
MTTTTNATTPMTTATAATVTVTAAIVTVEPPLVEAAAKQSAAAKSRPAAKATPTAPPSSSARIDVAPYKVAAIRAPRFASKADPSKRRKKVVTHSTVSAETEAPDDLPEPTVEDVRDALVDVAKTTDRDVTQTTVATEDTTEAVVTKVEHTVRRVPEVLTAVPPDDFDSSKKLGAYDNEVPLEFDLSDDELDRLGANGRDTFDERRSHQVLHDAAPLYEGPWA